MNMKKIILLLTLVAVFYQAKAQCDPAINGLEARNQSNTANISNLMLGGSAFFRFNVFNAAVDANCIIPVGKFRVILSFPQIAAPYVYDGVPTFTVGLFTFNYDPSEQVLIGANNTALDINWGGETVLVPILGTLVGTASTAINVQVLGGISNSISNDNSFAPLNIVAAVGLPLNIVDYTGFVTNCDATLKWATSYESNVSRFEVEQSNNSITFTKVGTVAAKNLVTGSTYQYNYTQGTGNFYYRLKMIDKDGSFIYSKIVNLQGNCGKKSIKVYPNPVLVNQMLQVNIAGYENKIKGDLYSVTGQFVRTFNLKNGNNALDVSGMAHGMYTLRVIENGITQETIKLSIME